MERDSVLLCQALRLRGLLAGFRDSLFHLGVTSLVLAAGSDYFPELEVFRWASCVANVFVLSFLLAWGYFAFRYGRVKRALVTREIPYVG